MFDILLESRPNSLGLPRWGIVLAVGLHAAAIGAALRSPARSSPEPRLVGFVDFPAPPATPRPGTVVDPGPLTVPAPPDVDRHLPEPGPIPGLPDLEPAAPVGGLTPRDSVPDGWGGRPGDLLPDSLVQEHPELLAGPLPVYPAPLRDAGVEGIVMIQIVVDTLGRPEPGSARIVQHAKGFEASAVTAVLAARFRPARVWGRAVRVLVQVPVAFRLHQ